MISEYVYTTQVVVIFRSQEISKEFEVLCRFTLETINFWRRLFMRKLNCREFNKYGSLVYDYTLNNGI